MVPQWVEPCHLCSRSLFGRAVDSGVSRSISRPPGRFVFITRRNQLVSVVVHDLEYKLLVVGALATKSLSKHADRAELHCTGQFIAAARTGPLGFRAHGLTPFSRSLSRKQRNAPPSGAKAATAPGKLLSRCTRNRMFLDTNASNQVSEQNSCRSTQPTTQLRLAPAGSFTRKFQHQMIVKSVFRSPLPTRRFPTRLLRFRIQNDMVWERCA